MRLNATPVLPRDQQRLCAHALTERAHAHPLQPPCLHRARRRAAFASAGRAGPGRDHDHPLQWMILLRRHRIDTAQTVAHCWAMPHNACILHMYPTHVARYLVYLRRCSPLSQFPWCYAGFALCHSVENAPSTGPLGTHTRAAIASHSADTPLRTFTEMCSDNPRHRH